MRRPAGATILEVRERRQLVRTNSARRKVTRERKVTENRWLWPAEDILMLVEYFVQSSTRPGVDLSWMKITGFGPRAVPETVHRRRPIPGSSPLVKAATGKLRPVGPIRYKAHGRKSELVEDAADVRRQ